MIFPTLTPSGKQGFRTAWYVQGRRGTKAFIR